MKKTSLRLGVLLIMLLAMSTSLMAVTITNTNTSETFITIQNAIDDNNTVNGHTISIGNGTHTEYAINVIKDLTIQGQGAQNTVVQAHANIDDSPGQVFYIPFESTVTIKDMAIIHGKYGGSGGGIENQGTLTVENCKIAYNQAEDGGGGIYNREIISLTNCTINNNRVVAIFFTNGGGLKNNDRMKMTNCTICGNTTYKPGEEGWGQGAGIYNECYDFLEPGALTLTNCTISNNSTFYSNNHGGGIYNYSGIINSKNTIIANNWAGESAEDFYFEDGTVSDNGYNIVETGHTYKFNNEHSITGEQANLNLSSILVLNNTIHGTKTLKTTNGSVAINAGTNIQESHPEPIPPTDQRGANRNGATDIGAYEYWNDVGSLPVELSSFTAQYLNNTPTLYWTTQSETDNLGWNIYRNTEENFSCSQKITDEMIQGNGTTTEPSYYIYNDTSENLTIEETYYYWLESIDYSGISQVYSRIAQITIPDPSVNPPNIEPPIVYDFKNVPNPVNSSAKFQFTLDKASFVSVSIYNIKGKLVKTLPLVVTTEDVESTVYWNGKDNSGKELSPGVYFYNLVVNGKTAETRKLILMK